MKRENNFFLTSSDIVYLSEMSVLLKEIESDVKNELEVLWLNFWQERKYDDYERLLEFCNENEKLRKTGIVSLVKRCEYKATR